MKESPFIAVLKRELDRMVSRRIYFASCIVLPLFSIFFISVWVERNQNKRRFDSKKISKADCTEKGAFCR